MIRLGTIDRLAVLALARLGVFPHEFFYPTPFKILEYREMTRNLADDRNGKWLDVGCGNGFFTLLLGRKCREIVGVDLSRDYIETANFFSSVLGEKVRASFHRSRLEELRLDAESFDKVFSFCVIEHIDNYMEVLREIVRLLRPGGELRFSADCLESIDDPGLIETHRRQSEVVRYFRREELAGVLASVGFREVRVDPLFCSDFARELFIEGIRSNFVFGRVRPLYLYRKLRREEERLARKGKGLFLLARAVK